MLGEEEVRIVLCLLDEAIDSLFGRGIRWWFQGLKMLKDCLFQVSLIINTFKHFLPATFPLLLHLNAAQKPAVLKFISDYQFQTLFAP